MDKSFHTLFIMRVGLKITYVIIGALVGDMKLTGEDWLKSKTDYECVVCLISIPVLDKNDFGENPYETMWPGLWQHIVLEPAKLVKSNATTPYGISWVACVFVFVINNLVKNGHKPFSKPMMQQFPGVNMDAGHRIVLNRFEATGPHTRGEH